MPNEELVCPACDNTMFHMVETIIKHKLYKHWYNCPSCGLTSPWEETPEEALANFKAIRFDRVV